MAAALDPSRQQVERQVADGQPRRLARAAAAPQQRLHARQQLGERERLGQVIVAAGLQPLHAIVDGVARAEDQHRHLLLLRAQLLDQREAVELRQHHVDHGGVVAAVERLAQRLGAGRRRRRRRSRPRAAPAPRSRQSPDRLQRRALRIQERYRWRTYDCHAASNSAVETPRTPGRSALVSISAQESRSAPSRDDELAEQVAQLIDLRVRIHIRIELLQRRKVATRHGLDQTGMNELAVFIERDGLPKPARVVAESRVHVRATPHG